MPSDVGRDRGLGTFVDREPMGGPDLLSPQMRNLLFDLIFEYVRVSYYKVPRDTKTHSDRGTRTPFPVSVSSRDDPGDFVPRVPSTERTEWIPIKTRVGGSLSGSFC